MLIKPKKLQPGDTVATVSPSWGGAGDPGLRWRYEQGVKRLEEVFGLKVVPMPNSLKGGDYVYENPQARAEDLMAAFKDERIKGIITNIGGDDSIRLLPYMDFDVIRDNPKIFMGYSDVTISHLFCLKAGISAFYGPAILTDFAENVEMDPYTIEMVKRTLFSNEIIGEIQPAEEWTSERLLRYDYVEGTSSSPVGYLEGLYVKESFRKQGIAKQLVQACEDWAKEKGCSEFASDCELENEESLAMHLKLGFSEANRVICFKKVL